MLSATDHPVDYSRWVLKLALIKKFKMTAYALPDSEVVQNKLSKDIAGRLAVSPEETRKNITVAMSPTSSVAGILRDFSVTLDEVTVELGFVVLKGSHFDVVIRDPSMESLKGLLHLL